MKTTSAQPGLPTSAVEVLRVDENGFWLRVPDRDCFLDFAQFPWFRGASIEALSDVSLPTPQHLYWPTLDIDLALESVIHPDRYPLISRAS